MADGTNGVGETVGVDEFVGIVAVHVGASFCGVGVLV